MPETKIHNNSDQQGVKFTQKYNLTTFLNWARWVLELVSFWPTVSFVSLLVGCNTFIDRSFRASFFLACWTKKYNQNHQVPVHHSSHCTAKKSDKSYTFTQLLTLKNKRPCYKSYTFMGTPTRGTVAKASSSPKRCTCATFFLSLP